MHRILPVMKMPFNRFRNRGMGLRPVNRIKHVFDGQGGVTVNTQEIISPITTKDAPVLANTEECITGSKVNGIYLKVEVYATSSGALSNIYMYFLKNPSGTITTVPNPNVVGASDLKKYVIHQEMVMVQRNINGNPRTLFNGVIVFPRGYKRNGPDDRWNLVLYAPGISFDYCVQAHYKEFR